MDVIKNNFNSKQWWHEESKTSITYWGELEPYNVKFCIILNSGVTHGEFAVIPKTSLNITLNDSGGFIETEKYKLGLNKTDKIDENVSKFISGGGGEMFIIEYVGEQRGLGGEVSVFDNVTRHTFTSSGIYTP